MSFPCNAINELEVNIIDKGENLYIFYASKSDKPILIYEHFLLNTCNDKSGFCMQEEGNTEELYFFTGGTPHKKIMLQPHAIHGIVAAKRFLPFKEETLQYIPKTVVFKFFLPGGDVVNSEQCSLVPTTDSFKLECN